eukprot:m.161265 g.161265  ORF g.161265 m.161265 type:complete len:58 (-) comp15193_c12_seq2:326-499(-)
MQKMCGDSLLFESVVVEILNQTTTFPHGKAAVGGAARWLGPLHHNATSRKPFLPLPW